MSGKSLNSLGGLGQNYKSNSFSTQYTASGKSRDYHTFVNAPGSGAAGTGGTIIDGGDGYIYHIFTGAGTFQVTRPAAVIDSVEYLIIAGGGGVISSPTYSAASGGGGGGGFLFGNISVSNSPGTYPVSVGAGGPNVANSPTTTGTQRNGSPSSVFGLTATGGGSGGNLTPGNSGRPGGSGGGGSYPGGGTGNGNTPVAMPRQGYSGPGSSGGSSGGGGAGGPGVTGGPTSDIVGAGGPGRFIPNFPMVIISKAIPSSAYTDYTTTIPVFGGFAAGGSATDPTGAIPAPRIRNVPQNSGYGGQGANNNNSTSGGSGLVCIRYRKLSAYSRATGGTIEPNTHPEHPGIWRHIFTAPGTFTVTDPSLQLIDYVAVGGGGAGGAGYAPVTTGGGGGAGGFVTSIDNSTTTPVAIPEAYPWSPGIGIQINKSYSVSAGSYAVAIGTGGAGSAGASGTSGGNTTIGAPGVNQIIAYGGGGGAYAGGTGAVAGQSGGSGGGGTKGQPGTATAAGGAAAPAPLTQGNNGGGSAPSSSTASGGGGGGGAGAAATSATGGLGGNGGDGWYSLLSPSAYGTTGPIAGYRYFAGGGGGGGGNLAPNAGGTGGAGGGGTGTPAGSNTGTAGATNTGGGGGAGGFPAQAGKNGGPGIVIIQYPE